MENASKALIMAGSVMLAILVIALLTFAWSKFSDFYSSQDELRYTEDIAKFNEQFSAYDRDNVTGYEIVSLANRIADYNFRFSNSEEAKNNINGNPIELRINFISRDNIDELSFDYETAQIQANWFFNHTKTIITTNANETKNLIKLFENAQEIELTYGSNPETAARVAKAIDTIVLKKASERYFNGKKLEDLTTDEQNGLKNICLKNYNIAAGKNYTSYDGQVVPEIGPGANKIYKYYEYYKFKQQKYNCTNFNYDNQGRVNLIEFTINVPDN